MSLSERRDNGPPTSIALATEKGGIFGDPDAEVVVLLSQSESDAYQVVSFVRILGHQQDPLRMLINRNLRASVIQAIEQEMRDCGATSYGFLNRKEALGILNGESSSPLGDVLKGQNFSKGIRVVDIRLG